MGRFSAQMLRNATSGHIFGMTQNAGMGWSPAAMLGKQFLILSTQGGIRAPDGSPIALGYHTGHWEVGLLVQAAAGGVAAHRAKRTDCSGNAPEDVGARLPIGPVEGGQVSGNVAGFGHDGRGAGRAA